MIMLAAYFLIVLHAPGGREILLNTEAIASLHAAVEGVKNRNITDAVRCVIATMDGKLINVVETCDEIRALVEGK